MTATTTTDTAPYTLSTMHRKRGQLAVLISKPLAKAKHRAKYRDYVGCSQDDLYWHIERQFAEGMTWENHGMWCVCHIAHSCCFDQDDETDAYACNHWSNLRPYWAHQKPVESQTVADNQRAIYQLLKSSSPMDVILNTENGSLSL